MARSWRRAFQCLSCVACACSVVAIASADSQPPRSKLVKTKSASPAPASPPIDSLDALANARLENDLLVADDEQGRRVEFTIDPGLQRKITRLFLDYKVPYASLVAIEPSSGRVLAYISHSSANPGAIDLARDPTPPAASVFKLVTSAALIESGVSTETKVCYGGGSSRLESVDLKDDKRRDRRCATLADALGGSINSVFAKLADRHLDPAKLRKQASAFGFGQRLPFAAESVPSPIEIPSERLEFARTAAGFWHSHMSPLHGALLAAMIANEGVMPHASLIDRIDGRRAVPERKPQRVLAPATARAVGRMMLRTVRDGTAHSAFYDARGRPLLPGVDIAGKTGTLTSTDPYRAYSWWVGFAPADKPTIALAALVVNEPLWRIKSSFVAQTALHEYLLNGPKTNGGPHGAASTRRSQRLSRSCGVAQSCERARQ